jgi:hypothetical protein
MTAIVAQGKTAADFASPIISQAKIAQGQLALIGDAIRGLTGSLSISVGFTQSGGSASGGVQTGGGYIPQG